MKKNNITVDFLIKCRKLPELKMKNISSGNLKRSYPNISTALKLMSTRMKPKISLYP